MSDVRDAMAAWGLKGDPVPLPSLQGGVVRVGRAILKPVADAVEAEWCAEVLDTLPADGFRLARPLRTPNGAWIAHGFSAWSWVEGEPARDGHWAEVLAAGRALHLALAEVPCPNFLQHRSHRWAIADRVAWGEAEMAVIPALADAVARLRPKLRPVAARPQIVHGDLSGNTLLAPGLPPAVIDFSPYWRPPQFAAAVIVVDALLWHGAPPSLIEQTASGPDWHQHLARAWLFRVLALSQYVASVDSGAVSEVAPALAVLSQIEGRL